MNLYRMLNHREKQGRPVRVGLIGAGKFGSMFLAQARFTKGLHILAVADLLPDRARQSMVNTGWSDDQLKAADFSRAFATGATHIKIARR